VTIASGEQEIFVQTTGEADVYVTDLNGEVKQGDLLTVSPLKGILMKIDSELATVVAIAIDDLSGVETETRQIESETGMKEVSIGKIKVNLDHKAATNQGNNETESALQKFGREITGKDIGEIRLVVAMLVFLLVLAAEASILYSAISGSITAIGRNPLAKDLIRAEMLRVVLVAIGVLVIGLAAIYAILWL
jgi:hypothetical protein